VIRKYQLTSFFVLSFLLPWAVWATTIARDHGWTNWHVPQALAFWLGLTTATFGTAALAEGWPGVKDLLVRIIRARVDWQWYAIALLLTPALAALAVELGSALQMPTAVGREVAAGGIPVLLLVSLWLFLLTEESAWRGFALPRLQARMRPVPAALLLGMIWGLWHIPLFLIADTFQSSIPFAGFLMSIVATSALIHRWGCEDRLFGCLGNSVGFGQVDAAGLPGCSTSGSLVAPWVGWGGHVVAVPGGPVAMACRACQFWAQSQCVGR
jgi:membrane protease YdiL (CAAX protease family)